MVEIVPEEERLIAEMVVVPTDIASVHVRLAAELRFPDRKQRLVPQPHGRVDFVSADAIRGDWLRTTVFCRAEVPLDPGQGEQRRGVALLPGVPVDIVILVGERSFWHYITWPLRESFARVFREPRARGRGVRAALRGLAEAAALA